MISEKLVVDRANLPPCFPTHLHAPEFWEALGRTIATFGFLEWVLSRAIFCFTGARQIADDQIDAEVAKWILTLEKALTDTLVCLIDSYCKAVRAHDGAAEPDINDLERDLRETAVTRNALCHASWDKAPDSQGRSVPFYVDRKNGRFQTLVDIRYLENIQSRTVELACAVIDSVTRMGWQFPGSNLPGQLFFSAQRRKGRI